MSDAATKSSFPAFVPSDPKKEYMGEVRISVPTMLSGHDLDVISKAFGSIYNSKEFHLTITAQTSILV